MISAAKRDARNKELEDKITEERLELQKIRDKEFDDPEDEDLIFLDHYKSKIKSELIQKLNITLILTNYFFR